MLPPRSPLAAFAVPGFRLFTTAQFLSFTALTVQMIARGWAMQQLTNSPFMVSLVGALQILPAAGLSFVGGEISDRFARKWILLLAETGSFLGYASLAVLSALGIMAPWHILVTTAWIGSMFALANPSRQGLIVDLVPPSFGRKSITAYMLVINLTVLTGPLFGGPVLTGVGMTAALGVSALMMIPAIPLYGLLRPVQTQTVKRAAGSFIDSLVKGVHYVRNEPEIRWMFAALIIMVIFINTWGALFPTIAHDVLHRGAGGLTAINLAVGTGAISGAILAVFLEGRISDAQQQLGAGMLFAAFVILMAVTHIYAIALIASAVAAAAGAPFFINNMGAIQLRAPEEFRARVISVRFVVSAVQPFGIMTLGAAAQFLGPQIALGGSAAIGGLLLAGMAVTRRRVTKPTPSVEGPLAAEPSLDPGDGFLVPRSLGRS